MSQGKGHRYIYGLDGLRALAVLAVIVYHLNLTWAMGGFLGVDIFFVLSGYLITSIILPAKGEELSFKLKDFWISRIRRLLPAAYVMIMTTMAWVVLFKGDLLSKVRGDAIASLFYSSNWWFIFHKVSYFDSFGSPSPLKNLWSLAIEEQFYLLWPLLLIAGLALFKSRLKFAIVVLIGAVGSAVAMGMMYEPGMDPSRIYYGTDTRSFELLIGCFLALIWPMKRLSTKKLPKVPQASLNIIGCVTLLVTLASFYVINEYQSFVYQGGMFLFCLNAAVLIACVVHPSSFIGKVLSWKPLRWIGTRSYGIYLWHYPVIVLGTPIREIGNPVYWHIVVQLLIVFVLAEWSYRFVEVPIRTYGIRAFLRQYVQNIMKWRNLIMIRKVSTGVLSLILVICTTGIIGLAQGVTPAHEHTIKVSSVTQGVSGVQDGLKDSREEGKQSKPDSSTGSSQQPPSAQENQKPTKQPNEAPPKQPAQQTPVVKQPVQTAGTKKKTYRNVLAIGDSVMLDIAKDLRRSYPNMKIDGKVGRQMSQALSLIPQYKKFNQKGNAVIIELGTNGYFTDKQIDRLLQAFSNTDIYLVNTRVPRSWESVVNQMITKKGQQFKNVKIVDWHSLGLKHPEYFAKDGVHLTPTGSRALSNLILSSFK
ncbi:acyltransferase family protein [Priestia koreensis]|uniref:acyltransferase family protein n=1 Tax=Priestia koreensis TaxID=284581 RepID=UPI003D0703DB